MTCIVLICSRCCGRKFSKSTVRTDRNLYTVYTCDSCALPHYEEPVCGGEVRQVTKDGKVIECMCSECGGLYGADAIMTWIRTNDICRKISQAMIV